VHRLTAIWLESQNSPATAVEYYRDLTMWLTWCAARDLNALGARVADVDLYKSDLTVRYAPGTVARRLSSLSSWYRYLLANEACERNPALASKRPQLTAQSATTSLSRHQVTLFLHTAAADAGARASERDLVRARTAALLAVFVTTGLRVAEVCAARIKHLGHTEGYDVLWVTRKGGKRQAIRLEAPVRALITTYLNQRTAIDPDGVDPAQPLFVTVATGPHSGGKPMDRQAIGKLIRRIAKAAAIPSWAKLTPHSLRHSFVTLSLDAGAALRDVQDAAGHANANTTRAYDRNRGNLRRHPAGRLMTYLAEAEDHH
jgi:integrase/recombinase XerD